MTVDVNAYPVALSTTAGTATLALTLAVGSATPTIAAQSVDIGQIRLAYPVALTLSVKDVALTPGGSGSTSYTLSVDSATPTITPQTVDFEEVHEFTQAQITLVGQSVGLGVPVSIVATGASVTPSMGAVAIGANLRVAYQGISLSPQAVGYSSTINVVASTPTISAGVVGLNAGQSYTITVDSLSRTLWGESVDLILSQPSLPVTAVSLSLSPQSVGFALGTQAEAVGVDFVGNDVALDQKTGVTANDLIPELYAVPLRVTITATGTSLTPALGSITLTPTRTGVLGVTPAYPSVATFDVGVALYIESVAATAVRKIKFVTHQGGISLQGRAASMVLVGSSNRISFKVIT